MAAEEERLYTHEAIIERFTELRTQAQQLAQKSSDVATEAHEHETVLNALTQLDPKRKCYRQVGGVLVERTVEEVIPAVKTNKEQLEMVRSKLAEQLKAKNEALTSFQAKHKIRIRNPGETSEDAALGQSESSKQKQIPAS